MFKWFFHRQISALECAYGYDATYLHEVLDISTAAFLKFTLFQIMSADRHSIPRDAWFAARIAAALSEDCGPCTQLVVDMALRDGMAPDSISALLRGDIEAAGADAALGFRYGVAVTTNSPDAVMLVEHAEKRFGKRGLVSLDFGVAASRVYPTVKRGLGHGAVCTKVIVGNDTVAIKRTANAAFQKAMATAK